MIEQGSLDLIGHRHLRQDVLQRRVNQVVQRREHSHQITFRLGNGHILSVIHQLTTEIGTQEGALQELLRARIHLVFRIAGAEQVDPLLQLPQAQGHDGLPDGGGPVAQGKIGGVDHFQQAIRQAGVGGDHLLNFLHVGLIPGDGHHELEEIALDIRAAVGLGGELARHIGPFHPVRPQGHRPLIGLRILNVGDDALDIHAVGHLHRVADGDLGGGLGADFDKVDVVQQGKVPGGELEVVHRHAVSLPDILLHQMHGQRVDNHRVVDLNHQVALVKQPGGLLHQQHGGEGHKVQRSLQHLGAVLG